MTVSKKIAYISAMLIACNNASVYSANQFDPTSIGVGLGAGTLLGVGVMWAMSDSPEVKKEKAKLEEERIKDAKKESINKDLSDFAGLIRSMDVRYSSYFHNSSNPTYAQVSSVACDHLENHGGSVEKLTRAITGDIQNLQKALVALECKKSDYKEMLSTEQKNTIDNATEQSKLAIERLQGLYGVIERSAPLLNLAYTLMHSSQKSTVYDQTIDGPFGRIEAAALMDKDMVKFENFLAMAKITCSNYGCDKAEYDQMHAAQNWCAAVKQRRSELVNSPAFKKEMARKEQHDIELSHARQREMQEENRQIALKQQAKAKDDERERVRLAQLESQEEIKRLSEAQKRHEAEITKAMAGNYFAPEKQRYEKEIEGHKTNIKNLESEKSTLKAQNNALGSQKSKLEERNESLSGNLSQARGTVEKQQRDIDALKKDNDTLKTTNTDLTKIVDEQDKKEKERAEPRRKLGHMLETPPVNLDAYDDEDGSLKSWRSVMYTLWKQCY